jgi:hypothetical protein
MELIRTSNEDTPWQSDDFSSLFRRKIMIEIAKTACLNIHTSVQKTTTTLIVGL